MKTGIVFTALLAGVLLITPQNDCQAQQNNWYPYVIARGEDRAVIQNTPIELRPNRPLHFYGNIVRRNVARGNAPASGFTLLPSGIGVEQRPANRIFSGLIFRR